jgi:hypothetical protein
MEKPMFTKPSRLRLMLLIDLLLIHGVVSALAMYHYGFIAIFEVALSSWASGQVLSDLSVSLVLVSSWMLADARRRGKNAWLYVLACLPLGSFAPLTYLIVREWQLLQETKEGKAALA